MEATKTSLAQPPCERHPDAHGDAQCVHCGFVGQEVHYWRHWVGGRGMVDFLECDDRRGCWQRMNVRVLIGQYPLLPGEDV